MTPEDALKNKVSNSKIVQVKVEGTRPLIFDDVVVRISPRFATYMHIDYDEANACGLTKELVAIFLSKRRQTMNVSEMENLIQQITDRICQQLLSSSYSVL